jgi:hypothetical protein
MATTTLQIGFGNEKMVLLAQLKKADGVPSDPDKAGYLSDDMYAKKLLIEKMDEKLLKLKPAKKV